MNEFQLYFRTMPKILFAHSLEAERYFGTQETLSAHLNILYIVHGTVLLRQNETETVITPGSTVILPGDLQFSLTAQSDHKHLAIGIHVEFDHTAADGLLLPQVLPPAISENPIPAHMEQIILQFQLDPSPSAYMGRLLQLLGEISELYLQGKQPVTEYGQAWYVDRAKQYIHSQLASPLRTSDIAKHLGISSGYLSHLFSQYTGQTITQYSNSVRVDRIEELVLVCGLDIQEAGKQVGLSDPTYVSRLFKKIRGCSLTELRYNTKKQEIPPPKRHTRAADFTNVTGNKDDALRNAKFWYRPTENSPNCRFATKNRKFQGIPSIEHTSSGRLYVAMYGGMTCEESGNFVIVHYSDVKNPVLTEPYLVIEAPTPLCRTFDPCLWMDPGGRLWLFYTQSFTYIDGRLGVWASVCENPDAEIPVFSIPRRIANGVMMNKPTVLSSGEWLLCCTIWCDELSGFNDLPEERFSNVYCSSDQGKTFRRIGHSAYPHRSTDEHMIVEKQDGRLWMLIRGKYGLGQSFSQDKGFTWYDTGDSGIANPCSRFHIRRLSSGRLLLINHHHFHGQDPDNIIVGFGRNHLTALLSDDDGKTWAHTLELDPRDDISYPDMTESADGRMYIVYDRCRYAGGEILLASITEEDILAEKLVSDGSFLQKVISKGGC